MCGIGTCEFVQGNSNDNGALALLEHVRGAHAIVGFLSCTELVSVTSLIAEHSNRSILLRSLSSVLLSASSSFVTPAFPVFKEVFGQNPVKMEWQIGIAVPHLIVTVGGHLHEHVHLAGVPGVVRSGQV